MQNAAKRLAAHWQTARIYCDTRALILLALGIAAAIPNTLIFTTLTLWLGEAGIERKTIAMFSWASLAYSFKFIWSPLLDAMPLPLLSQRFGQRRAWLLLSQCGVIAALCLMALTNPQSQQAVLLMAAAAVLVGFFSATQDIAIDAYRIEIAEGDYRLQAVTSAMYVAGYRIGMLIAGAGALYLAQHLGSSKAHYRYLAWQHSYFIMAGIMGLALIISLIAPKPKSLSQTANLSTQNNLRLFGLFLLSFAAFILAFRFSGTWLILEKPSPLLSFGRELLRFMLAGAAAMSCAYGLIHIGFIQKTVAAEAWLTPISDFFQRYGKSAAWLLLLIGFYRISDIVAGSITNLFYQESGFSKTDIAKVSKIFGLIMTLSGGFIGGLLSQRYSLMKLMLLGAALASASNLLFAALHYQPYMPMLYLTISFDNLAMGLSNTIFVAFLSALTNIRFSATQYAIFSSLMTLFPKILGGYSGAMVDTFGGYPAFFAFTTLLGLPILALVYYLSKRLSLSPPRA